MQDKTALSVCICMYLYVSYMNQRVHPDGQRIQVFGQPQAACDVEPCMVSRYGRYKQKKNAQNAILVIGARTPDCDTCATAQLEI